MTARNREIEEKGLNEVPIIYTSVAGSPYVTRIKTTDVQQGVLKVVDVIDFDGKTDLIVTEIYPGFNTYDSRFEKTIKHNYGKYTYPMGQMQLGGFYFPLPFPGQIGIEAAATFIITKNELTIRVASSVFTEELNVKARVYLLRETMD